MSKSEQFDLQLNRRQMMLMSGAACACGAWGRSAFAQANQQFQGCVEVEPWYTVQLKRNPNAPQTIAAANQLSAVRAQSLLQGGQGGGQVAAALGGNVPRSRVASGLNQAARNQVSFALQQHLNGQASSPSSAQGRPLQAIVARTKLWPCCKGRPCCLASARNPGHKPFCSPFSKLSITRRKHPFTVLCSTNSVLCSNSLRLCSAMSSSSP